MESSNHRRWRIDMQVTTTRHARDHALTRPKIFATKSIPKTVVQTLSEHSAENPMHSDSGLPFRNWIIANRMHPKSTDSGRKQIPADILLVDYYLVKSQCTSSVVLFLSRNDFLKLNWYPGNLLCPLCRWSATDLKIYLTASPASQVHCCGLGHVV